MSSVVGVVVGMIACYYARNRLSKRAVEIAVTVVRKKAIALHNLVGDYNVLGVTADITVGISGRVKLPCGCKTGRS